MSWYTNNPYATNRMIEMFENYCERMCEAVKRLRNTNKLDYGLPDAIDAYNHALVRASTVREIMYHVDHELWERAGQLLTAINDVAHEV